MSTTSLNRPSRDITPSHLATVFARNMRRLRIKRGYTLKQMAELAQVDPLLLRQIEDGRAEPPFGGGMDCRVGSRCPLRATDRRRSAARCGHVAARQSEDVRLGEPRALLARLVLARGRPTDRVLRVAACAQPSRELAAAYHGQQGNPARRRRADRSFTWTRAAELPRCGRHDHLSRRSAARLSQSDRASGFALSGDALSGAGAQSRSGIGCCRGRCRSPLGVGCRDHFAFEIGKNLRHLAQKVVAVGARERVDARLVPA